jgi:hypothetical protein
LPSKAIHEITQSRKRGLFVRFSCDSWIVLTPGKESTKPKLGHLTNEELLTALEVEIHRGGFTEVDCANFDFL